MTLAAGTALRAPFPWPGGKRRVAGEVWQMLGQPGRYIEPFAGSLGVLLGRPAPIRGLEVVNDLDGYIVNVWRALKADPLGTIRWADDMRSEYDLTARHLWLVNEGAARLRDGLQTSPDWYDAQTAGWWLYGVAMWIGDAFASGTGPWTRSAVRSLESKLPHLGDDGRGVHRQLPHLGNDGQGENPDDYWQTAGSILPGVYDLAAHLSQRLARVVVTNGDWQRVLTNSTTRAASGYTAIYLDPPYDGFTTDYAQSAPVWDAVVDWCNQAPASYRIVLSGYAGSRSPDEWREIAYTARGTSSTNKTAERFWVSLSCVGQQSLFAVDAGGAA